MGNSGNKVFNQLPDIWGSGRHILAWHGFFGETKFEEPFNCTTLEKIAGLKIWAGENHYLWFYLEVDGVLYFRLPGCGESSFEEWENKIVSSDLIDVSLKAGNVDLSLRLHFLSQRHLAGKCTILNKSNETCRVRLTIQLNAPGRSSRHENSMLSECENFSSRFVPYSVADSPVENLHHKGEHLVFSKTLAGLKRAEIPWFYEISYDRNFIDPEHKNADMFFTETKNAYMTIKFPEITSALQRKTILKAFSIIRVNTETAQGAIPLRWTTPDRVPHRMMWLWDSVFHAIGIAPFNAKFAEDAISSVLLMQREDGFIAHMHRPSGTFSKITQPPILAWGVLDVFQIGGNIKFLEASYPRLARYLEWNIENRDRNGNGLLEWLHADESGMDDSPRHDRGMDYDAVDFNAFQVNEYKSLAKIAEKLSLHIDAAKWTEKAETLSSRINTDLWNSGNSFYMDKYFDGSWSDCTAISGFVPLFAGIPSEKQARKLADALEDEKLFNTKFPIPGISISSPEFCDFYWRGPSWINYNYLTIKGLQKYGFDAHASRITELTLGNICRWYGFTGTIWEFYDSNGALSPARMLTRIDPREDKFVCRADYGWSAALFLRLAWENGLIDGSQSLLK